MYIAGRNKYNWNACSYYKICYIYIYIAARNKYSWNAFNNVTKTMLVLYKICYIYILPHETSTTGAHSII